MKAEENVPQKHHVHRKGEWLPQDHRVHREWLSGIIDHVDQNPKDFHPAVQELNDLIESNTRVYLEVSSMFEQVPNKKPYKDDPTGYRQVRDYHHMLAVINHLLTVAPYWTSKGEQVGLVGLPINASLDWPMATPSGFAFFLDPEVNTVMKKILNAWGEFLQSPASTSALDTDKSSWFGEDGHRELTITGNIGKSNHSFEEMFECDPSAPHKGYKSWDHFFTRTFREGIRPVAGPDDDSIIANACESKPYNLAHNVKARDKFWVKGQPYSLVDMFAQDPLAEQFVGGTIYQAFLSALSYHRWHSPISGTVKKAYVIDGTYYSEPLFEDFSGSHGADVKGEGTSQGYLTAIATRAVIFFEADNPAIGLMAFLGVGMAEVSTCDITVKEGQKVKKGDQIGMFHFGGSTHCLMFRKGVEVEGFPEPGREHNVPVRGELARVKNK